MNNIPEEQPIYYSITKTYRGEAVGGPFNDQILEYTSLTIFHTKPYRTPVMPYGSTIEEQVIIENRYRVEYEKHKNRPERYDFNVEQGKWIWIDYESE